MGLPLFVAPTPKDAHAKATGKDGILGPSRSAIRRQPIPRDRHGNQTRQAALRALWSTPPYLPPALERYHGGSFPWNNSEPAVDPERRSPSLQPQEPTSSTTSTRPTTQSHNARSILPDPSAVDERLRNPLWEFLRNASQSPPVRSVGEGQPDDRSWWPTDLRQRPRRARVVTPAGSRQTSSNRRLRPRAINSPPPPLPGSDRATRPAGGLDGLGDRDRSLSPEGWDPLRTILTLDTQPASAESSFASATSSHAEGPFSFYDAETSQGVEGPDGGCESGGDDSGTEAPDFEEYQRHMRRRRAELRHRSLRIPDVNPDGRAGDEGSPGAQQTAQHASRDRSARQALRIARIRNAAARLETMHTAPSGDETETDDRSRQAGEETGGRRVSANGEDDWVGLQRIMHNLAARDEIPDEMWAEVGLIRTLLRQEETN